jgi:hypothetical protein
MFYLNRFVLKTALFSTLAFTCITAYGQPNLVFTETAPSPSSPFGLTANIGTIIPLVISPSSPQSWDWVPPSGDAIIALFSPVDWIEPAPNPLLPRTYNEVSVSAGGILQITSDIPNANGTIVNDSTPVNMLLVVNGATVVAQGVQFIDRGDVTVPDGGTTVILLGTALTGIALLKRKVTR